jgi:DNA-binding NarL/FixJ family response regulator
MWKGRQIMSTSPAASENRVGLAEIETAVPVDHIFSRLDSPHDIKRQFGGLTRREREVAVLVTQGKSNREIAQSLVLSEYTVASHVSNILSKLEFSSRTQIVSWAIGTGLAQPQAEAH